MENNNQSSYVREEQERLNKKKYIAQKSSQQRNYDNDIVNYVVPVIISIIFPLMGILIFMSSFDKRPEFAKVNGIIGVFTTTLWVMWHLL